MLFHLQQPREKVADRIEELHHLAAALDRAIDFEVKEEPMTDTDLRRILGHAFDESWASEAEERWSDTDAWSESRRRTASSAAADWEGIKAEASATTSALAEALRRGEPATSQAAMDAAEVQGPHRQVVPQPRPRLPPQPWRHVRHGPPLRCHVRRDGVGRLAGYVRDAIDANADRQPT